MKYLSGGEHVIKGIKNTEMTVVDEFKTVNKPKELTNAKNSSNIVVKIKKRKSRNT